MPYLGLLNKDKVELSGYGYHRLVTDDIVFKMSPPPEGVNPRCVLAFINITPLRWCCRIDDGSDGYSARRSGFFARARELLLEFPEIVTDALGWDPVHYLAVYDYPDAQEYRHVEPLNAVTRAARIGETIVIAPGKLVIISTLDFDLKKGNCQ